MANEWANKVVLITGASSGIGAATAIEFARVGAKVVLHGRNDERLKKVARECEQVSKSKGNTFTVIGDIEHEEEIRRFFKEAVDHFGNIHVLVNNAGIGDLVPPEIVPLEMVDKVYKILFRGPLLLCQLALPYLKKNKGCVINVSSFLNQIPTQLTTGYQCMKAALSMLTKSLGLDWATYGVRVVGVSPGWTDTDIFYTSGIVPAPADSKPIWEGIAAVQPFKRIGRPEEIAKVIRFAASDDASYMSATDILVDGAVSMLAHGVLPLRLQAEEIKASMAK